MFPLYKKKIIFHLLFCYIIKYEKLPEKEKSLTAGFVLLSTASYKGNSM